MIAFINNLDIIVILDSIINLKKMFLDDKYTFAINFYMLYKFIIRLKVIFISKIILFWYSVITITLKAIVNVCNCRKLKRMY